MKKLIKLDANGSFTEVDALIVKKCASTLKKYITQKVPKENDPLEIWKYLMPLCDGVLNETIKIPIPSTAMPYRYSNIDGLFSREFEQAFSPFFVIACGSPIAEFEKVEKDGETYAYVDFNEYYKSLDEELAKIKY